MSSTWESLTAVERLTLYRRRYEADESVDDLSAETGIPSITLNRRLQEFRREVEGLEEEDLSSERTSIGFDDANHMWASLEGVADDGSGQFRVKSLEDLLTACGVDQEDWSVENYLVNTWEGFRKEQKKDLTFTNGVANGSVSDTGGFRVVTLYQVKARLVRRKPIEIAPVVSPVNITLAQFARATWSLEVPQRSIKRTLVIPDLHIGFKRDLMTGKLEPLHDRTAMSIVLQVAASDIVFDEIVLLGDLFDLTDWSDKFLQSPEFYQVTQPALEEGAWFLAQLRAYQPQAKIYVIEGNHEKRLRDSIVKHVPQAYGIRPVNMDINYSAWSIPTLLNLKGLDIAWVGDYPDGIVFLEEDLACVHGLELSADKAAAKAAVSIVFGHIHRYEAASSAMYNGRGMKNIYTYSPGFLGRLDGIIPGVKARQRWSQGFGIVEHAPHLDPNIQHITIRDGRALVNGNLVVGADYREQLIKDLARDWRY